MNKSAQRIKLQAGVLPKQLSIEDLDGDAQLALIGFIPHMLESLQCDSHAVLEQAGINPNLFEDVNATISISKACRLLEVCANSTATEHFGLLMGQHFTLPLLGLVDSLMRQSNTVHTALQQLIQHLHLNDRGATVYLIELNQDEVAFGYSVFSNKLPGLAQLFDYSMANAQTILQHLCGPTLRPKRISFAHSAPKNLTPYEQQFNTNLFFDSPRTEIVFSKHWLNTSLQSANVLQHMSSEREARILESKDQHLFLRSVRNTIHTLLLSGDASAVMVCRKLHLHERILRRHLQAQGTSIKQVKSYIRFNLACQLLGLTKLSLTEIATALGYSDSTALSRAFQQHAHVAPAAWRKKHALLASEILLGAT